MIEAVIDFADEDVPEDVTPEVGELLVGVRESVAMEVAGGHFGERVRGGVEGAVFG